MRILLVIHTWHPEGRGGSERHARETALVLQARGHQVGVFTRTDRADGDFYGVTTEQQESIGVTRINNRFWDAANFEWTYKNRRVHEAFLREIDEFKPDLVHIHHFIGLSTTIVEALKRRKIPVVVTLHDFWTFCPRGQRMTKDLELCWEVDRNKCFGCLKDLWPHLFAEREDVRTVVDIRGDLSPQTLADYDAHMVSILNLCDRLITPSEFHRERMLDFPLDAERIVALPHGLDTRPFEGVSRQPREPRVIGYIGSVFPIKGVHVLLEAFKRLNRPDLLLTIHGESRPFHDDTTYQERLDALAEGMENVSFHGSYDPLDVPMLLADIDILVVPSVWWETYCLTIREGLLAGLPVVAPDLGAMREALDGERDGLLYRPGDAEDLARKLERLLTDERFRNRYLNRGSGVKGLDAYSQELETVYTEAIEEARRRAPTLEIAPSSFPESRAHGPVQEGRTLPVDPTAGSPAEIPWEDLGVAVRHQGPLGLSFSTRMPSDDEPALGLDITLTEGGKQKGEVGVIIDLRALQRRLAQPASSDGDPSSPPKISPKALAGNGRGHREEAPSPRVRRIRVTGRHRLRSIPLGTGRRREVRLSLGGRD